MKSLRLLIALVVVACAGMLKAADAPSVTEETKEQRDARMKWWREAKFGMFIHWGVYSVPAGKYGDKDTHGEWIMCKAKIPMAEYAKYAEKFNPVKFNAEEWVKLAKAAGQKYMVITSKHHDGFAMFKSATSSYNIYDATPFKRDPLKELAEACRKEGIKLGFYYSEAQDWGHPGGAAYRGHWDPAQDGSFDKYLDEVAVPQVKEILSNYGPDTPAILWWDTPAEMTPERAQKLHPLLKLRPGIITNNRLGGGYKGDTETPEQHIPSTGYPGRDWETCMTMNGHWGYCAADENWKSTENLIRKFADICSKGGNFLLNVGPTSEGLIPAPCVERLKEIGKWMEKNGEAIYGTSASPFAWLSWGRCTRKGQKLYLHVFDWPADGALKVPIRSAVNKAYLLVDSGKELKIEKTELGIQVKAPVDAPDKIDSVVVLEIEGEPVIPAPPALGKPAKASSERKGKEAANAFDGTPSKVWAADKDVTTGWLEVDLGSPVEISAIAFEEPGRDKTKRGQKFEFQYKDGDKWTTAVNGKTSGQGYTGTFKPVTAQVFRLNIVEAKDSPGVSELQLFQAE